jgi:phosphoglycolate phosphatase
MHVLFDLDGTLTDPFTGITRCIQHALGALGRSVPPADQLGWCIGPPLTESLATLLGPALAHLAGEALDKYRERFGVVGLFENEVYPDVRDVLAELRRHGHCLHVATSKPTVFARRIVDHFALGEFFTSVEGSELAGARVDKTSLIAHILLQEGVAPADAVMIGDREHDIIGAHANGVGAVGVLWGYGSREELDAAGAFTCVATPRDLIAVVEGYEHARSGRVAELERLIRTMEPVLNPGTYVFVTLPDRISMDARDVVASVREPEGLTVVLEASRAAAAGLTGTFPCAWITLSVNSALDAVGLTGAFSGALGRAGISCNVVAGTYHDHIFVPVERAGAAMRELRMLQQRS